MGAGFVEVTQETVSVLTDMAVLEHEIDETAAEEAIRRAEEAMKSKHLDEEGYAAVQAAIQKSYSPASSQTSSRLISPGIGMIPRECPSGREPHVVSMPGEIHDFLGGFLSNGPCLIGQIRVTRDCSIKPSGRCRTNGA